MDGDICTGKLHLEIGFEMVGKIVGLIHRYRSRYNEMEFDKDLRT